MISPDICINHLGSWILNHSMNCDERRHTKKEPPRGGLMPGSLFENTKLSRRVPRGALSRGSLISAIVMVMV